MKKIQRYLTLGGICLLFSSADPRAQDTETQPESAPAAATAAQEAAAPAGTATGIGAALGGDMPFSNISGDTISFNDGILEVTGRANVVGDELAVQCERLTANTETKMITAKGAPARIKMGDMNAVCRDFTYDMEKKQSRLEGNPIVTQKAANGETTEIKGDIITLTQGADGKVGLTISRRPGSDVSPTIQKIETKRPAETTTNTQEGPAKVTNGNLDILKIPTVVD